jgi:ribokinase
LIPFCSRFDSRSIPDFDLIYRQGRLFQQPARPRQLSARGRAFFESLAAIDILVLNQFEADLLVPRLIARWGEGGPALTFSPGEPVPALAASGLVGGGFEMSIVAYLQALTQMGPGHVIVTDGSRGAFVGSRDEIFFSPALETKIVGTAGAGDAFGATISAYLALGHRIDDAICAAAVVELCHRRRLRTTPYRARYRSLQMRSGTTSDCTNITTAVFKSRTFMGSRFSVPRYGIGS